MSQTGYHTRRCHQKKKNLDLHSSRPHEDGPPIPRGLRGARRVTRRPTIAQPLSPDDLPACRDREDLSPTPLRSSPHPQNTLGSLSSRESQPPARVPHVSRSR
ncbi:hypothetical protein ACG83_30070 [Frankia sp. R43]|nr:hypothetical protein ACG83_30070 [Frankia sp. R43]